MSHICTSHVAYVNESCVSAPLEDASQKKTWMCAKRTHTHSTYIHSLLFFPFISVSFPSLSRVCLYACIYIYMYICRDKFMYLCIHTHTHTNTLKHVRTHTHAHACTRTHVHTHSHTQVAACPAVQRHLVSNPDWQAMLNRYLYILCVSVRTYVFRVCERVFFGC